MCTLIAQRTPNGLLLGMNRDEMPERTHTTYHTGAIWYPVDETRRGTWIGVSLDGCVSALLNRAHHRSEKSRGELVPYYLNNHALPNNLTGYAGFVMFTYGPSQTIQVHEWDGHIILSTVHQDELLILTASRYGVADERFRLLKQRMPSPLTRSLLVNALCSHEPEKGPISPCVHTPTIETIASTIIEIRDDAAGIEDLRGNPCTHDYQTINNWRTQP